MYAVCAVPVAPVRNEPVHHAEMTSQLLFGECGIITEITKDGFAKITVKADGYNGWCQLAHMTEIKKELYDAGTTALAGAWVNELECCGTVMHVPLGSSLTGIENGMMVFDKMVVDFKGTVWNTAAENKNAATIQQLAFRFLNTPYLWGGRSVFGIDCSGFSQVLYKLLGIALLRDAHQQATQGTTVDFLQEAQCGDLAFFDNENGEIIHVGVLLNDHEIIHASGKVQVDNIDNSGIINRSTGLRTQKLRIIKRYI